jgi:flagellar biosynthesis GTPase FlhF
MHLFAQHTTRELPSGMSGKRIEVTACLEKPSVGQASEALSPRPVARTPRSVTAPKAPSTPDTRTLKPTQDPQVIERLERIEDRLDRILSAGPKATPREQTFGPYAEVSERLRRTDVPETFVRSFLAELAAEGAQPADSLALAHERLVPALAAMMLPQMRFDSGDRILVMGPAGSGKSSVIGRLATRLVAREKRKVRLVTLDDVKIAAYEEIAGYADILGADITDLPNLAEAVAGDSDAITLIDSAALPRDNDRLQVLQARIDQVNPTHRLAVYSALTRADDMVEFTQWVEPLGPTHVVMTMLDLTWRQGSLIAAAESSGLKIAFVTAAPGGEGDLSTPDPDLTARRLLQLEARSVHA